MLKDADSNTVAETIIFGNILTINQSEFNSYRALVNFGGSNNWEALG